MDPSQSALRDGHRIREAFLTLTSALSPFASADIGRADAELTIAGGDAPVPIAWPGGGRCWQGSTSTGVPVRFGVNARSLAVEVADGTSLVADRGAGRGTLRICPTSCSVSISACMLMWICELIADRGWVPLHAAALACPGQGNRALLLTGPSGRGKTTAALGLTLAGWRLLADDLVFLRDDDNGTALWGWPRAVHVHRRTVELLPDLKRLVVHGQGEDEATVAFEQFGAAAPSAVFSPAALLWLDEPNDEAHHLDHWDAVSATASLARENLRTHDGQAVGRGGLAFAALVRLVREVPRRRLSVGPEPSLLATFLGRNLPLEPQPSCARR